MSEKRKESLIETILKLTGMQEMIEKIGVSLKYGMMKKYPDLYIDSINSIFENNGIKKYIEQITKLYSDNFTEEELNNVVDFYTSSVGKKICDRQINKKIETIQEKWLADLELLAQNETVKLLAQNETVKIISQNKATENKINGK